MIFAVTEKGKVTMKYNLYREVDDKFFLWGSYSSVEAVVDAAFYLGKLKVPDIKIEIEDDSVVCSECEMSKPDAIQDGLLFCYNDGMFHESDHYCKDGKRKDV